jgi:hypothetical protein
MSNVLTFDRIKNGLSKFQNLGILEDTVEIHGMEIDLRTLKQGEHKLVNQYVASYMDQYEEEAESIAIDATMDFFAVRKAEPLTHAIMRIGDIDFRGIEYIETGEVNEEGVPLKMEKHVFVRHLLYDMDPSVIDALHNKYADMLSESEEKAAEKIKFRDPEEELRRVEKRREELYKELGREDELYPAEAEPEEEELGVAKEPSEDLSENDLRGSLFGSLTEEEARQALAEREMEGGSISVEHESSQVPDEPAPPQEPQEDGGRFIRLDDPETPYTEEEQAYFEEQEKILQERNGGAPQEERPQEPVNSRRQQDAQANLNKRRRQPLNRVTPRVEEGNLPSQQQAQQAPVVRKSQIDTSDLPIAEGFEKANPQRLNRRTQQGKEEGEDSFNQPPKGNENPHFKEH